VLTKRIASSGARMDTEGEEHNGQAFVFFALVANWVMKLGIMERNKN